MRRILLGWFTLSLGIVASATVEIETPESRKADAAWEKKLRRDFDFERLHEFLLRTLAEQKRFEAVDLATTSTGKAWVVDRRCRTLHAGSWWFWRGEKGEEFQFRYYPGEGERDVVVLCVREERGRFRFVKIRWDHVILRLVRDEERTEPATTAQRGQMSVVDDSPTSETPPAPGPLG